MSVAFKPLAPGGTLGVLGGGQLGRMWVHAAQSMGFQTAVLDPDPHSPAGLVSHQHIPRDYLDPAGLQQLASVCQAVTTEFENVPADALARLAETIQVAPNAHAVAVAQDRRLEKAHFVNCGVPVAPFAVIASDADLDVAWKHTEGIHLIPGILKTARMGYDGKGQVRVRNKKELIDAFKQLGGVPCVLEKMLPLQAEYSVIVARGHDGVMVHLPVQHNVHRDGILAMTQVWAGVCDSTLATQAINAAKSIAQELQYIGVLCVEFFVLEDNTLVVNEIAPRPHNSGHYSLDACDVSQFELQLRCMAGLPLTPPRQHSPAVMLNLLGDIWSEKLGSDPNFPEVLQLAGTHLHLYGKSEARKGRKMGHLTITASTPEQALSTANQAAAILGITAF
ncbi:MAG: 5-(carboxyamino)imidazole ribonucleotide synthase [Burkholderiales bacterium]|nr:5-(carboxyamino)imidazole ribonucleotide synthase [Burkholderiales bacterium]